MGQLREVSGQLLIVGAPSNRTYGEGTVGNYLTGLNGLGALEVGTKLTNCLLATGYGLADVWTEGSFHTPYTPLTLLLPFPVCWGSEYRPAPRHP